MIHQGLIEKGSDGDRRTVYSLTEKGRRVLELYKNMEINLEGLD